MTWVRGSSEGPNAAVLRQEGSITAVLALKVPHSTPPPQYHENRLGRGKKRQGGVNNGSSKIQILLHQNLWAGLNVLNGGEIRLGLMSN